MSFWKLFSCTCTLFFFQLPGSRIRSDWRRKRTSQLIHSRQACGTKKINDYNVTAAAAAAATTTTATATTTTTIAVVVTATITILLLSLTLSSSPYKCNGEDNKDDDEDDSGDDNHIIIEVI